MASSITIATGPLTTTRDFTNDSKVQATLLQFYDSLNIGDGTETNQEKLDAVLQWIITEILGRARRHYVDTNITTVHDTAETTYDLEDV